MPEASLWGDTAISVGILLGSVLAGLLLYASLFWVLGRVARHTKSAWDEKSLAHLAPAARLLFPAAPSEKPSSPVAPSNSEAAAAS